MNIKYLLVATLLSFGAFAHSQKQPVHAELSNQESFSIVVIPDIQSYVKFDVNQPILDLMTAWTANNIDRLNIKTVLCTGDIVEHNEIRMPDAPNGNQTSEQQWQYASLAFERLDNLTPYILCTGNHDYGYKKAENRMSQFHNYFPSERNITWKNHLVEVGNNAFGVPTLENAAFKFETETWGKLLILSLEFNPRNDAVAWANEVVKKYADHRVILLTHSYLNGAGELIEKENYLLKDTNYGLDVWNKLVKTSPNICFVLCGHYATIGDYEKNVSFKMVKNDAGKPVAHMMFNAQTADGQWSGNGGDGWLRYLEFMPDGKTIKVRTFSPLFAISPLTADKAWRTEKYDEFEFKL